ncbi:MAG: hypothetical protein NTU83_00275 [Candidatus Hydrogenedentes bacterium]|nr:hypothetical protein [Candidatus Hydrogenedentota bacterium]
MREGRDVSRRRFLAAGMATGGILFSGKGMAAIKSKQRIATFRCDVTPPLGTPIYSGYKPLATIEHPLLAKGIVLEDRGKRYVLCAVDWCELNNGTHTSFCKAVAKAAGTDPGFVAIQTVHQHTAPMADADAMRMAEQTAEPPACTPSAWIEEMGARIADAAGKAVESLVPFNQVGTSEAKVDRVASNRRVPIGDGKVGFRGSSCKDANLRALPEGLIDPMLKTITFGVDGKPLARLHYYATHPQSFYGDPRTSYDFVGIARERLQEKEGVFQIYFTGCGGNVAAGKYNDGLPPARAELADRLYAAMEASVAATQFARTKPIHWSRTAILMIPRNDGEYDEAASRKVLNDPKAAVLTRLGSASNLVFHARQSIPVELSALHIGHVHIVHLPGEPMIEYQFYAQEQRPKDFVAVAGYGDCGMGYICLERFFAEGGYEPTASAVIPASEKIFRKSITDLF